MKRGFGYRKMGMDIDIGFVVNYLVIPIILAISLVIGKKKKKHFELAIVYGFKGMFYWYSALMNFISFFNQTWSEKYVVGFAIGLAILEGTNGMLECYEECLKNAREKQNIKDNVN
ncbi:MAG: hypothetical protein ACLUTH_08505 [Blautia massiliensis (ex Durand et al. 2017)]